ncbi:hypothetical protein DSO57_1009816 [Entomophthora muscae]|uniref:Uncharacterized protein n=1 Tax=Entomophthora muscae TaxID=34485 RepID=A0ACC2RXQ6_9FUNG|nr:hypothetical protein DSO57_1009816 [Entomophthora muscae]
MGCWWDDNKALAHKIASLETKLLEALSQEGSSNKSHRQNDGKLDGLDLDLSNSWSVKAANGILRLGIMALHQLQEPISIQDDSPLVNPSSQSGAPKLSEFGPAVWLNHEPYGSQHPLLGTSMDVNVSPGPTGFFWTC